MRAAGKRCYQRSSTLLTYIHDAYRPTTLHCRLSPPVVTLSMSLSLVPEVVWELGTWQVKEYWYLPEYPSSM